jgi:glycosyltransferase involved in cell wall biosynthesis
LRISIFTPSHQTVYLPDLYQSLLDQSWQEWEWVLVLNNGAVMPEFNDPRVRIIVAVDTNGVGALKKFACGECKGEYLVECDHDDILTDDALAKIDKAITESNADFLYSECVEFNADGTSRLYGAEWGWQHAPFQYKGKDYQYNKTFPLNARTLAEIFSSPNHIRVVRAETYRKVGGHDPSLMICDDFDLVCRLYLSGAKFCFIPEVLYFYRIRADGNNSWLKYNGEIQDKQRELGDKYRVPLILEWCRRERLEAFDLGGAINKAPGFKSVDTDESADIVWDVRRGLPFSTDSVGCIRASDFLEHTPTCPIAGCDTAKGFHIHGCCISVMNEIHRVLVPGGWLISRTPSSDGRGAFQDFTHASRWNRNSFFYFCRQEQQRFIKGITAKFQEVRVWDGFPSDWERTHQIPYIHADLVALKPGYRPPGIVEI